jgi:hypothetical protein
MFVVYLFGFLYMVMTCRSMCGICNPSSCIEFGYFEILESVLLKEDKYGQDL